MEKDSFKQIVLYNIKKTVDVEITELLGSERIVYFNIGNKKCSAKLPAEYNVEKTLDLSINESDIYKFDSNSNRIY